MVFNACIVSACHEVPCEVLSAVRLQRLRERAIAKQGSLSVLEIVASSLVDDE